ncbi:MAG: phosphate ABC transporter substrate-binding protein [Ktedonobacteraceae bacterium]|nr:phosphate ABC transporter substrate-binding protein [Ktedonobacteraceae bacterium]
MYQLFSRVSCTRRTQQKRWPILPLISMLVVILFTGCTGPSITPAKEEPGGHILAVGSTALQPLVTAAAEMYQKKYPAVSIEVRGGGSITGLQAVASQKADIGSSDIYADPALYPDPRMTDHIVCVVPFTMVTGPGVTVTSLTRQQIIDIYSTGKIRNWREVGGPDLPIVPIVRPASSGTRATFRKYVLDGRDEIGTLLKNDSSTDVRDKVAHTPGAIGYLGLAYVDSSVRAIAIDGKMATQQNIASGAYTYWSYEHMYTLGDDNALLNSFLDFMLTPEVQQQAQKMGYIPIANMKLSGVGKEFSHA